MPTEPLPLVIKNLSFRYRTRTEPALRNLSLEVQKGEILLVVGVSGCGKTTLMRCINGLAPRSYKGDFEGEVWLNGQDVQAIPLANLAQTVGTLLQDPERQILGAYVHTELAFGPENLGLPAREVHERIDEALARLGISHLRERETFSLSGGEKQKVALAGVLAMRPSILLLDEPLASLDPASAHEALAVFRKLADEGATILLVEHRVEDALAARPDRVLYLENAEMRYLGSADGLADVVDWREIKLPAPQVMRRARREAATPRPPPSSRASAPAQTAPLIAFKDVSFGYGDEPDVLKNITFDVQSGEIIALLGPNGAGKSTLVKHAIGLVKPRSGQVLVEGKDTRQLSVAQIAHTLGYCFQSPAHMLFAPTVKEELEFGPRNLGHAPEQIQSSIERSLDTVNLQGLEEFSPLGLSFGQQKRVTIACVLAMRSKILVLDEPTAGQDFGNYMSFMDSMAAMQNGGAGSAFDAIIFITHDLDLAITYASRVILLADGTIAADGTPPDVLQDYDLLKRCRVVPTSLLEVNRRLLPKSGRFMRAEDLAALEAQP